MSDLYYDSMYEITLYHPEKQISFNELREKFQEIKIKECCSQRTVIKLPFKDMLDHNLILKGMKFELEDVHFQCKNSDFIAKVASKLIAKRKYYRISAHVNFTELYLYCDNITFLSKFKKQIEKTKDAIYLLGMTYTHTEIDNV